MPTSARSVSTSKAPSPTVPIVGARMARPEPGTIYAELAVDAPGSGGMWACRPTARSALLPYSLFPFPSIAQPPQPPRPGEKWDRVGAGINPAPTTNQGAEAVGGLPCTREASGRAMRVPTANGTIEPRHESGAGPGGHTGRPYEFFASFLAASMLRQHFFTLFHSEWLL